MIPRLILVALSMLSLTGCVAAVPMVAQLAMDPHSTEKLCAMTKLPGQDASFCDRFHFASAPQAPIKAPVGTPVTTAAR